MQTDEYKMDRSYKGAFFLEREKILKLSEILKNIEKKMIQEVESLNINDSLKSEYSQREYRFEKTIKVDLGEKKIVLNYFEDILTKSEISKEPVGFEICLEIITPSGYKKFSSINIETHNTFFKSLDLKAEPADSSFSREAYERLKDFFDQSQPNTPLRLWSEHGWWFAFSSLMFISIVFANYKNSVPSSLSIEAKNLVIKGVNDSNSNQAISLLLRHLAGEPATIETAAPKHKLFLLFSLLIIPIVSFIRPTSYILGIKNGQIKIKFWNFYFKLIFYSIPISVIAYLLQGIYQIIFN